MSFCILEQTESKELHSNAIFDNVKPLNEKPSELTEGLSLFKNSDLVKSVDGKTDTPILTDTPNLYKHNGVSVENFCILENKKSEELKFQENFDELDNQIKKMPEIGISGEDKTGSLVVKPQLNGTNYSSIVAEPPNFRKDIGVSMSNEGFIKLPRSLLKSEAWKSLRLRQQKLFLYILEKAQFTHFVFKYNGKNIQLAPGDLCNSYRGLAEDFNQTVKFRNEKIDASFVQRSVSTFLKLGLTDTRTDTGILLISITYPGIYDHLKTITETPTDTDAIHLRYTNEERKNERILKETIDGADALDSSLFDFEKEKQKKTPSVFNPQKKTKFLSHEKKKEFDFLWAFVIENSMSDGNTPNETKGIKEKDIEGWISKYEESVILECLKRTLKKKPNTTWPGYVNRLLSEGVIKNEVDKIAGRQKVEGIIKKNKMKRIELKQDYFIDKTNNETMYYHINTQTITEFLRKAFEREEQEYNNKKKEKSNEI